MLDKIVEFNKPFVFEGKEYKEIDLSKIEELLTEDLLKIDKMYDKTGAGLTTAASVLNLEYAILIASYITELPIEFFYKLPAKESRKISVIVSNFFIK